MSEEKMKSLLKTAFDDYMVQNRLRRTHERYAILDHVLSTSSHFTIDALQCQLDADGYHVSRATVYNTIKLLIDAGLVKKNSFGAGLPCYEKIARPSRHYHLICNKCGKIKEIKDAEIDDLLNRQRYPKFHPLYIDLYIHGLCQQCTRKQRNKQTK